MTYVSSEERVQLLVKSVEKEKDEIETRKKSLWQVDVLVWAALLIISTVDWVSSCQDRGTGIEASSDTSLCDGNCLLFHNLMDGCPVILVHFIKFINTANTLNI